MVDLIGAERQIDVLERTSNSAADAYKGTLERPCVKQLLNRPLNADARGLRQQPLDSKHIDSFAVSPPRVERIRPPCVTALSRLNRANRLCRWVGVCLGCVACASCDLDARVLDHERWVRWVRRYGRSRHGWNRHGTDAMWASPRGIRFYKSPERVMNVGLIFRLRYIDNRNTSSAAHLSRFCCAKREYHCCRAAV